MYRPLPNEEIARTIIKLRDLYRRSPVDTVEGHQWAAARESFCSDLISNLRHAGTHPTPRVLYELSRYFRLTVDGAYRMFGYDLSQIQAYDFRLNSDRTHLIESYAFRRDMRVDVPLQLGDESAFSRTALLQDLVKSWQTNLSIRSIAGQHWQKPGMFYVVIGTSDSIGSGVPAGAVASVQPVSEEEQRSPKPNAIYLLQTGNCYCCYGCVVHKKRLSLIVHGGGFRGVSDFLYPGEIRILGRLRMFATELPLQSTAAGSLFAVSAKRAALVSPWDHHSLHELFGMEGLRIERSLPDWDQKRAVIEEALGIAISARTFRRYRQKTKSTPHTSTLIALSLAYVTRYSDVLRTLRFLDHEDDVFSLEHLLGVNRIQDLPPPEEAARRPYPEAVWNALMRRWGEWPLLLSMKMPQLAVMKDNVLRIVQTSDYSGLDPIIPSGSLLLTKEITAMPNIVEDCGKVGWLRPIYTVMAGDIPRCGYLELDERHYILVPHPQSHSRRITIPRQQVRRLALVIGVAVPVR
jgi:hypothetical protein